MNSLPAAGLLMCDVTIRVCVCVCCLAAFVDRTLWWVEPHACSSPFHSRVTLCSVVLSAGLAVAHYLPSVLLLLLLDPHLCKLGVLFFFSPPHLHRNSHLFSPKGSILGLEDDALWSVGISAGQQRRGRPV